MVRLAQIEPHQSAILLQVFGDLLDREVLDLEPAVPPQPGVYAIALATGHGTSLHSRVCNRDLHLTRRRPAGWFLPAALRDRGRRDRDGTCLHGGAQGRHPDCEPG